MAKKSDPIGRSWILFFIAILLLMAGWMMKSFPILIFTGIAPLFAIADASDNENPWSSSELILLALAVSLFSARTFNLSFLVGALTEAIILTLAFVGHAYVRQNLGFTMGKSTIIIFWLGIEYIFLTQPFRESIVFIGDALQLKSEWLHWTHFTGYLGASLWILICNLFFYMALFKKDQKLRGVFFAIALISIIGPIILSYRTEGKAASRSEMISVYQGKPFAQDFSRFQQGEVVPRTAAGISLLILVLTFAKTKTQKSK